MGVFDVFRTRKFQSISNVSVGESDEQGGRFEPVEIVGESFYSDSFKELRAHLGKEALQEAWVQVELRQDPGNPHALDGKAVSAHVNGFMVGHVSAETAKGAFDELEAEGGSRIFDGRIFFGDLRERPTKNSVSITWSVLTKTAEQMLEYENQYRKQQEKRERDELAKVSFLGNPEWSRHTLAAGDFVTFTGFSNTEHLPKLIQAIIGAGVKAPSSKHLLVVHPSIEADSAKLRDWLASSKPATNLQTFLDCNSEFSKYFNSSTIEFEVPSSISGKRAEKPAPTTKRVFESDETLGRDPKRLPGDSALLLEQTLARYPSFTDFGSFPFRLSDVKLFRPYLEELFAESHGGKTDALVLRGNLKTTNLDGATRLVFEFRGNAIGYVPKNETRGFLNDSPTWKTHSCLALITWSYKNVISGAHDASLTEGFWLG